MKIELVRKIVAAICITAVMGTLSGCGSDKISAATNSGVNYEVTSGPYADKDLDLSKHENVVMYVLGDRPADMDEVLEKANKEYFEPNLNTDLSIEFLNWSDYQTKYPLLLSGGEQVDLIYTASWCFYNEEIAAGAFKELDEDFLMKYMPYTFEEEPSQAWDEISVGGKIYAVPKGQASFTAYDLALVRKDLIDKYNLTEPTSWDNFKKYLIELAEHTSDSGVTAMNTNANREQLLSMYLQSEKIQGVTEGYDWEYVADNSEAAPKQDDIFYLYTSDKYKKYCEEMAELADKKVWSSDAINDTTDSQAYFENGTSGAFVWNTSIFTAGKNFENAGLGEYAAYDVTPDTKRARGAYSVDAIAITSKAASPERAALTLDYMKSDVNLNRLLLGGIEGKHWELAEDGTRKVLDAAANYGWNSWAWAINRQDEPAEYGLDKRQTELMEACEAQEFVPEQTGFTFNPEKVQSQYQAVSAIVDEYKQSFALGIYGDATDSTFDTFKSQLEAAGIDTVTEEFISQYNEYMSSK